MDKKYSTFDENTILSTPRPFATSTEARKQFRNKRSDHDMETAEEIDSDESLGIISIKSEDFGPFIDQLQLKDTRRTTMSYAKEQKELASKTLQKRESKNYALPSRLLRPSELSDTSNSCISIESSSTVNESDLLKQSGFCDSPAGMESTLPLTNMRKLDIAQSMAKLSLEIRNPSMSLTTALQKMEEEYQRVRDSISIQSDNFKPAEEAESQLLADEASWKREKDLPVDKVDFTVDNFDASKLSISAFFKQRCEDISDVIPSSTRKCSVASDFSDVVASSSRRSSIPIVQMSSSGDSGSDEATPQKESLSISKIAKILQDSKETPNKVLDYLYKQCSGSSTENYQQLSRPSNNSKKKISSPASTDDDSSTFNLNTLTSNKENFNSVNIPNQSNLNTMSHVSKSLTSLRSTSSLSNLPGGKLPIETTNCELVWGCVKTGKIEAKQFTLRNRSSNRLRIQCTISGPLFRIMQERAEDSTNSIKLMLHPHETKSIAVIFNPLTDGAAADEIVFSPCDANLQQTKKQSIKLFGYGGIGNIEFKSKILRDSISRYCLNLGNIFGATMVSETIKFFNKGSLSAFAFLEYEPKDFALSKISVVPDTLILGPNEELDITITFKPNKEDIKYLQNCMVSSTYEIGTVRIISGSEALRGRIKRLCKLAIERNLDLENLSKRLLLDIKGETIPSDVIKCRESINSMKTLLHGLVQRELLIILEKDMDCTLVPSITDETSQFHSLKMESTIIEDSIENICKIEPLSFIFTPPSKLQDWLFLISESNFPLEFDVSVPEGMGASPSFGQVEPRSTKAIQLSIGNLGEISHKILTVSVNFGGEVTLIKVKIVCI